MRRLRYHAATAANGESTAAANSNWKRYPARSQYHGVGSYSVDHGARVRRAPGHVVPVLVVEDAALSHVPASRLEPGDGGGRKLHADRRLIEEHRTPPPEPLLSPVASSRGLADGLVGVDVDLEIPFGRGPVQLRETLVGRVEVLARLLPVHDRDHDEEEHEQRDEDGTEERRTQRRVVGNVLAQPLTEPAPEATDADERQHDDRDHGDGQDDGGDDDHRDTTL